MLTSVTYECVETASNSRLTVEGDVDCPPPESSPWAAPSSMRCSISCSNVPLPPVSAISSAPSEATSPVCQMRTSPWCIAPTRPEKWRLLGKLVGWVSALQVALNVTR